MKHGHAGWLLAVLGLFGCASQEHLRAQLIRQARFDLPCPNHVELEPLQERNDKVTSYAVIGCGKSAAYVLGPNATWVMTTRPRPDGAVIRP